MLSLTASFYKAETEEKKKDSSEKHLTNDKAINKIKFFDFQDLSDPPQAN